jgi:hypothetical protein
VRTTSFPFGRSAFSSSFPLESRAISPGEAISPASVKGSILIPSPQGTLPLIKLLSVEPMDSSLSITTAFEI